MRCLRSLRPEWIVACAIFALIWGNTAWAQPLPQARLSSIFPPAAKIGGATEVTITGVDLDECQKLVFSHPGITAAPKTREPTEFETGSQFVPNVFIVTVNAAVPAGRYEARAVGLFGASDPRSFEVSTLDETVETEPNNDLATAGELKLGMAISGRADGTTYDIYKFAATKGQRLLIDCAAQRLDSKMDATLAVFDAAGREVAFDRDTNNRDPLVDFTAPADGQYFLRVYDFLYAGGPDFFYRVALSAGPQIDFVFPPSGPPGSNGPFTLYGRNLPGGAPSPFTLGGKKLEQLQVQIPLPGDAAAASRLATDEFMPSTAALADGVGYRHRSPQGASNAVLVQFSIGPVVVETEPNNDPLKPQKIAVPGEIAGQFYPRRDVDYFTFDAKKGDTYWIDVVSQRSGCTADPTLLVQRQTVQTKKVKDAEGKETDVMETVFVDVGSQDEPAVAQTNVGGLDFNTTSDDPELKFTAPEDGVYRIFVRDLYGDTRSDPRSIYRLRIRPEAPDFRLIALPQGPPPAQNQPSASWPLALRRGGTVAVKVMAMRRDGFSDAITVTAEGLPAGVSSQPMVIGVGQLSAVLVLKAEDGAADATAPIKLVGKAKVKDAELVREARTAVLVQPTVANLPPGYSRLGQDLLLSIGGDTPAPYSIALGDGQPQAMSKAGKLEIPVKVTWRNEFKADLALVAINLPANITAPNVTIKGGEAEGKFVVNFAANSPEGPFTFAVAPNVDYKDAIRSPKALKAAEEAKTQAEAMIAKTQEELKTAQAAKTTADAGTDDAAKQAAAKAATDADAKVKRAQALLAEVMKRLTEAQKKATFKLTDPSTTVVITVTPAPFTLNPVAAPLAVKQGAKAELTLGIARLYGFADKVTITLAAPSNPKGVKLNNGEIAGGQNEAKLVIEAAEDAAVGTYPLTVTAQVSYNGQNLPLKLDATLNVEAK